MSENKDTTTKKTKQAQNICARLQLRLINRGRWTPNERLRWDKTIAIILRLREQSRCR